MQGIREEIDCYKILMRHYKGEIGSENCPCEHLAIAEGRRVLHCVKCRREYDPRIKTAFDRSNTDLGIWFYAVERWIADIDYNANKLSNETGITWITARRIMRTVTQYIWSESEYIPTAKCTIITRKERKESALVGDEFRRPARTYKRKI